MMPGGMDMGRLMKQMQSMQKQMAKAQEELKERVVEAAAGGGAVTVHVNGAQEVLAITIKPEAVDPSDVSMLQDLVTAAVNEGLKKSKAMAEAEMNKYTGGMKIPGLT